MWEISISGQVAAFLFSLLLGGILAFFYDLIKLARKMGLNSYFAVFVTDILFWAVSAIIVFIYLVGVTNGEIRGYILFSAGVGFALYRLTLGRAVFYLLYKVSCFVCFVYKKILAWVLRFLSLCKRPVLFAAGRLRTILERCFGGLKKLLKSIYNMLYTVKDKKKSESFKDEQRG